ncbi:MAG TPA: aldo/keto reductase [Thermoanaerobaculia bacterium]
MRMIRFGRTGAQVPAISLGTWGHGGPNTNEGVSVGWTGHDDNLAKEAMIEAYRRGITHWDTADAYGGGHAETLIGEVFAHDVPRSAIFVATKFGYVKGPANHYYDTPFMRVQLEASLANMRTDCVDLYYFHHCDFGPDDRYFDDALKQVRRFREEGKIRFVGLSDWNASRIMRFIERVDPDVVQPYRNLVDDDYESSGLKQWVDTHDLGVAFFSPLKHGLLLGKYDAPQTFEAGDFRSNVDDFRDAATIERMKRAAAAMRARFAAHPEPVLHAVTGALLTGNPTATVLLGQRNPRQVEAASRVGEGLSAEEAGWVRSVYRGTISV